MPRDPVALIFDARFEEEEKAVRQWLSENEPDMLQGNPEAVARLVREEARALRSEKMKREGDQGAIARVNQQLVSGIPTSTADVGLQTPFGGRLTLGGVADTLGFGPDEMTNNPSSAAAVGGAIAASAIPGGQVVRRLAKAAPKPIRDVLNTDNLLGGGTATTILNKAEQIGLPALTAGTAAFGANLFEQLNNTPTPSVSSGSEDTFAAPFSAAFDRAKKEALFEGLGGVTALAGTLGLKVGARWLRGAEPYFNNALESMRLAGIRDEQITLADVSNNALISSSGSTLGVMPIPIIKGRFSRARQRRSDVLTEAADNLFWSISPEFALLRRVLGDDPREHDRLLRFFQGETFQQLEGAVELYRKARAPQEAKLAGLLRSQNVDSSAASFRATVLEKVTELQQASNVPSFLRADPRASAAVSSGIERANARVDAAKRKWQDAQLRFEAALEEESFALADTRTDPVGLGAARSGEKAVQRLERRIELLTDDLNGAKEGSKRQTKLRKQLEFAQQDLAEARVAATEKNAAVGTETPAGRRQRPATRQVSTAKTRADRLRADVATLEQKYNEALLQTSKERAPREILEGLDPRVADLLERASADGGEPIPVLQLVNLKKQIKNLIDSLDPQVNKQDIATLASLKAAIETDVTSAIQNSGNADLLKAYQDLQVFDGDWLTLLKGAAGQRAGQVRGTFGVQKRSEVAGETFGLDPEVDRALQRHQGPLDMDQHLDAMLSAASPEEIRQFALLLRTQGEEGKTALRFAAARALDRVIEPARVIAKDDPNFSAILGQRIEDAITGGDPRGKQAQRFWALIEAAGVPREEVLGFTNAAKILWRELPPDSNKFVMRSFILSMGKDPMGKALKLMTAGLLGASAAGAGPAAVGAAGAGPLNLFLSAFALERYSHIATSPRALRSVRQILDPSFGTGVRTRALERLFADNVFREWFGEQTAMAAAGQAADAGNHLQQFITHPMDKLNSAASNFFNNNPGAQP